MINAIAEIGNIISHASESDILDFLVPEATPHKYIVTVKFNLVEQKLEFDLQELAREKLLHFLYVGNESANRPQFTPTTDNLSYLISQTLPNLEDMLPATSELKKQIAGVVRIFFEKQTEKNKDVYILKDSYLLEYGVSFVRDPNNKLKKDLQNYAKQLGDAIGKKMSIKPKEALYTVLIDGQPIAQHPEYREFLKEKNLETAFEENKQGVCSVCGITDQITQDTTRFQFKFYMIDKINFAPNFDKKQFYKSLSLCKTCYKNLLVGEKWIEQNLRSRLGGFSLYIIPQLMWKVEEAERLLRILKQIPDDFNDAKNIKAIRAAEQDVQLKQKRYQALQQNPFSWNFLFYRRTQSAFKILSLIKDVPPSRILHLNMLINEVDGLRKQFFPETISFDLDQIFWLIPIKKSGRDYTEYKKILQVYYNIFSGYQLQKNQLYQFYVTLAHIHHYESYDLFQFNHSSNPDYALVVDTIKWNLFLFFLNKLNLIDGGVNMGDDHLGEFYPEKLKDYVVKMDYSPAQRGLTLLGYVLGVVAFAQYKSGLQNKPVLEKVNYQGMTNEKIIRLFNELFEKIRQYKVGYAERWWAAGKELYESGKDEQLTSQERVFYLLSGYALNVLFAGVKEEEKKDIIQEPIE